MRALLATLTLALSLTAAAAGDLTANPRFQAAVQEFTDINGRAPATDSDFKGEGGVLQIMEKRAAPDICKLAANRVADVAITGMAAKYGVTVEAMEALLELSGADLTANLVKSFRAQGKNACAATVLVPESTLAALAEPYL